MIGIVHAAPQINKSSVRYSKLYNFESHRISDATVGIKYVLQGVETYEKGDDRFSVKGGQYLLLNSNSPYGAFLKGRTLNIGVCIDISLNYLQQVSYALNNRGEQLLENPETPKSIEIDLNDGTFSENENSLGKLLRGLGARLQTEGKLENFTEENYYSVATGILETQVAVARRIAAISAKKTSVQNELYRRVAAARAYIDDVFLTDITIDDLAKVAMLSPFHFIRTFRQVYQLTPYQYVLELRLAYARQLLQSGSLAVTEVSDICGFSDVCALSKAFKRRFGVTPSLVIK